MELTQPKKKRETVMVLNDDQSSAILLSLAGNRGDGGFTVDEAREVLSIANYHKFAATMWSLVEKGLASVDYVDGDVVWKAVQS